MTTFNKNTHHDVMGILCLNQAESFQNILETVNNSHAGIHGVVFKVFGFFSKAVFNPCVTIGISVYFSFCPNVIVTQSIEVVLCLCLTCKQFGRGIQTRNQHNAVLLQLRFRFWLRQRDWSHKISLQSFMIIQYRYLTI